MIESAPTAESAPRALSAGALPVGMVPAGDLLEAPGVAGQVAVPADRGLASRFVRFGVGSVAATAASAAAFALAYRVIQTGPQWASVVAFSCGFLVNFTAGRAWAWSGRSQPGRMLTGQLISYLAIAIFTGTLATIMSVAAHAWSLHVGLSTNQRAVLVESAFFASYALTFLIKFVLLDRWVFRRRPAV